MDIAVSGYARSCQYVPLKVKIAEHIFSGKKTPATRSSLLLPSPRCSSITRLSLYTAVNSEAVKSNGHRFPVR